MLEIKQHLRENTLLFSPPYSPTTLYNHLSKLDYQYFTVNHSRSFNQCYANEQRQYRYSYMKRNLLYAVKPLWDAVLKNCLKRYNPVYQIALDEAMIRYKGAKASVKNFFMEKAYRSTRFSMYTAK